MRDMAIALALYWGLGIAWLAVGFLPAPLGWLRFEERPPLVVGILLCVVYGAIWPLVLGKIVYHTLIRGEKFTSL